MGKTSDSRDVTTCSEARHAAQTGCGASERRLTVTNTMSVPCSAASICARLSFAAFCTAVDDTCLFVVNDAYEI